MTRKPLLRLDEPYPWDRLMVSALVLLFTTPIVVYAWVALNADRDARMDAALVRNQATAQLIGLLIDRQCEALTSTLNQFGQRKLVNAAYRSQSRDQLATYIEDIKKDLPDVDFAAAYGPDGAALFRDPRVRLAPRSLSHAPWAARLLKTGEGDAIASARSAEGSALLFCVPVRDDKLAGYILVGMSADRIDLWLEQIQLGGGLVYVVTEAGDMLAGTGSHMVRYLPLKGYQPLQYAFMGQAGSMATQSPDSAQDHLVAYFVARVPRLAVLVTQPLDAAFATTNFLAMRLSVLLLPFLALVVTGVLERLRTTRKLEEMTRRLEQQNDRLITADKAKSDFLAQVSHDLRTPLAAMSVSLSSLLDESVAWDPNQARHSLFVVNGEVEHLTARVQGLLEMARLEAGVGRGESELRDLTDIVAAAVERLEPLLRGRELDESFPDEPLMVECDQGQIEKVVMNLVENAVKYSPPGSAIHVRGEAVDGYAVFTIRDEGPGLDSGDEERVFDKFFRAERTRSIRGTGLGLSICRAILQEHGGAIGACPQNGKTCGATFWFSLPLLRMNQEDNR